MTEDEIGEVLEISPATLHRDWQFARAWLLTQLGRGQKGKAHRNK